MLFSYGDMIWILKLGEISYKTHANAR